MTAFEDRVRAGEYFSSLRIPPGMWSILRLDGRSFHRFTDSIGAERPYDARLRDRMVGVTRAVFEDLGGVFGVTHSDEVSVLFRPEWDAFDRRVEKLVSIAASLAGAELARGSGADAPRAAFDARVWIGATLEDCVDYFRWRQTDAGRCAINAWVYWTMRREGASAGRATADLDRRGWAWKNEWLFQRGVNFDRLPAWQKRGVGVYWETVRKPAVDRRTGQPKLPCRSAGGGAASAGEGAPAGAAYDPAAGQPVEALRRRVRVDPELPLKEEYDALIRSLCR